MDVLLSRCLSVCFFFLSLSRTYTLFSHSTISHSTISHSLSHPLTHSPTYLLTHTHSLTQSLNALTQSLTRTHSHSLTYLSLSLLVQLFDAMKISKGGKRDILELAGFQGQVAAISALLCSPSQQTLRQDLPTYLLQ